MTAPPFDIAVIGAGIAGASAAAELASDHRVILIEAEEQPGMHATGRSAALFSETYGNAIVRALSTASRGFLEEPPPGFATDPFLSPRGVLHIGDASELDRLDGLAETGHASAPAVRRLSAAEALTIVPVLRAERIAGGVLEPEARDIDTHALLQGYLRQFRHRGGVLHLNGRVSAFERTGGAWRVQAGALDIKAAVIVNAAGAWADELAHLAGVARRGVQPKRRTAFLFDPPAGSDSARWPLTIGADESFYFKPDAGRLLASPADETPSEPMDAQADDLDIAIAIDRIQSVTTLEIPRIGRRWAGLRSFAPDRTPIVGFEPDGRTFFWLAGQGGYGFQTAPALARCTAALIRDGRLPADLIDRGITEAALSPARLVAQSTMVA